MRQTGAMSTREPKNVRAEQQWGRQMTVLPPATCHLHELGNSSCMKLNRTATLAFDRQYRLWTRVIQTPTKYVYSSLVG